MAETLESKVAYPPSGKYIVAVSGGVDSMVLLHMLQQHTGFELVVAHYDHGIREDSGMDLELVEEVAKQYGLPFVSDRLQKGANISEAVARGGRYAFLRRVAAEYEADGIITAHHLDDRIETMLLNLQRGAGWHGMAPLRDTEEIKRPLLAVYKQEIREYGEVHKLQWREDSTNQVGDTPRNYIRQQLAKNPERKQQLYRQLMRNDAYRSQQEGEIEAIIEEVAHINEGYIRIFRSQLLKLDVLTARDVLFYLLQSSFKMSLSESQVVRLEHFAKTALPRKRLPLSKSIQAVSDVTSITVCRLGSDQ